MQNTEPTNEDFPCVLPRFGLKSMFCLIAVIGIGTAWLLQPQVVCSVVVDFTGLEESSQEAIALAGTQGLVLRGGNAMAATDHCRRLRTPKVILAALDSSPELQSFAESGAAKMQSCGRIEWIYDRIEAIPVSDSQIRVTAYGDASDKKELQRLVEVMATAYVKYVDASFRKSLTAVWADPNKAVGAVTEEPTSWRVRLSFSR